MPCMCQNLMTIKVTKLDNLSCYDGCGQNHESVKSSKAAQLTKVNVPRLVAGLIVMLKNDVGSSYIVRTNGMLYKNL